MQDLLTQVHTLAVTSGRQEDSLHQLRSCGFLHAVKHYVMHLIPGHVNRADYKNAMCCTGNALSAIRAVEIILETATITAYLYIHFVDVPNSTIKFCGPINVSTSCTEHYHSEATITVNNSTNWNSLFQTTTPWKHVCDHKREKKSVHNQSKFKN